MIFQAVINRTVQKNTIVLNQTTKKYSVVNTAAQVKKENIVLNQTVRKFQTSLIQTVRKYEVKNTGIVYRIVVPSEGWEADLAKKADKTELYEHTDNTSIHVSVDDRNLWNSDRDKHHRHSQGIPSTIWTITHNLEKFPSVTIMDHEGIEYEGDVKHENNNKLTITFSAAISGFADLN